MTKSHFDEQLALFDQMGITTTILKLHSTSTISYHSGLMGPKVIMTFDSEGNFIRTEIAEVDTPFP